MGKMSPGRGRGDMRSWALRPARGAARARRTSSSVILAIGTVRNCSIVLSLHPAPEVNEKFGVALGALDRRLDNVQRFEVNRLRKSRNLFDHRAVHRRVANDSAPSNLLPSRLELRLDQCNNFALRFQER